MIRKLYNEQANIKFTEIIVDPCASVICLKCHLVSDINSEDKPYCVYILITCQKCFNFIDYFVRLDIIFFTLPFWHAVFCRLLRTSGIKFKYRSWDFSDILLGTTQWVNWGTSGLNILCTCPKLVHKFVLNCLLLLTLWVQLLFMFCHLAWGKWL